MGGEWCFHGPAIWPNQSNSKPVSSSSEKTLNVKNYQELLLRLKKKYKKQFKGRHVKWCNFNDLPPADNVFARFKFTCDNHPHFNEPEHPWFNLYWDPKPQDIRRYGSLHDRCSGLYSGDIFNGEALFRLQREIVEKFPDHFVLYREWTDEKEYDSKGSGMRSYYDSDF